MIGFGPVHLIGTPSCAGFAQHFAVIFLKALVVFARPTVASERHPSNDLLPQVYAGPFLGFLPYHESQP